MKYQINETFFEKIDTVQKAWMLGFIAADGCIYERDGHQAMLSISVRDYDIEILELFKRYISPEHSIIQVCDKRRPNTIMSTLQLTSDILCNSLKNIEIRPRKTFDLDITNILQKLPEEYRFAFVLGYFDGDGSVYLSNEHIYSNFTGTEHMLLGIKKELNNLNLNTKASIRKYPEKDIYDFKLGGINIMQKFYHILYDEATIFMNRKRNIFNDYFNNKENF